MHTSSIPRLASIDLLHANLLATGQATSSEMSLILLFWAFKSRTPQPQIGLDPPFGSRETETLVLSHYEGPASSHHEGAGVGRFLPPAFLHVDVIFHS